MFWLLIVIAVASLLVRRADGTPVLPIWATVVTQGPALVWWCRKRVGLGSAGASVSYSTICLTAGVVVAAIMAAVVRRDAAAFFTATTTFMAGAALVEVLADLHRRVEAVIDEPSKLLRILAGPWLGMILVGTVLLSIPLATQSAVPDYGHNFWLHILSSAFAAASAACLVGTTIYSFGEEYTFFGQVVLIAITQLAGMGMAAVGLAIMRPFMQRVIKLRTVSYVSLALQLVAVAAMWASWRPADAATFWQRAWWGLVHATSSLWNSGLTMRADGLAPYLSNSAVFASVTVLAIVGSLSLPVILDLLLGGRRQSKAAKTSGEAEPAGRCSVPPWRRLPAWEMVIALGLLAGGAAVLFWSETPWSSWAPWRLPDSWAPARPFEFEGGRVCLRDNMPPGARWTMAVFVSSTLRSAGLQSVPLAQGAMSWPSYGLFLLWMFIGGSAGGAAGGLRTSSLALLGICLFTRRYAWQSQPCGTAARKFMWPAAIILPLAAVALNAAAVGAVRLVSEATPYEIVFDGLAACSGVGLSTGLSLHLTWLGRLTMIVIMLVGRAVPVVLWLGVSRRLTQCLRWRESPGAVRV